MLVLPSGFALPPLPYLAILVGVVLLVAGFLVAVEPPVSQTTAVALAPWIAVGGALHAFYQLDAYPPAAEPLFGTPAVYLTTFVVTGLAWLFVMAVDVLGRRADNVDRNFGLVGTGVLTVLFVVAVWRGSKGGGVEPLWPAVAVVAATFQTVLIVAGISLWRTPIFYRTRYVGPVVVFAHALDGISTAIGIDVLGVTERSPLPRLIMDVAAQLPTAETAGVGWLFVVVKLFVVTAVVVGFNRYVDEEPVEATLVLSLITAVGLGPATNNLFLFLTTAV
ncbi:DUF63 family protein [Halomicrobium urmianum]|uniref:DUF63 family protein n=1 Tax=Halomicrobium urmianum TaxID=1586233 RepID=UPI001CD9C240|nr:DUF63 family protein [Halomicrobium urmianum]